MDNKYKKGAFIISIVLFVASLPFTIMGIIFHREQTGASNSDKVFHYKDKLYFYDTSKELLGTYQCTYSNCGYAQETNEDESYGIASLKVNIETDKVIDGKYAILSDYDSTQSQIVIYDIKNNKELGKYLAYKFYSVGISNNYIIVRSLSGGYYGVIQINNGKIETVIPFEYDYIALPNKVASSKVSGEKFIVLKDGLWSVIDKDSKLTNDFTNVITNFDDSTVITKNDNSEYVLASYTGMPKLNGTYKKLNYISNAIEVIDSMNNYYLVNKNTFIKVSNVYQINDDSSISTQSDGTGTIRITIDGESKETVEI